MALLLRHFSRYGNVKMLKTYQNTASTEQPTRFAFVIFKKSADGKKALQNGSNQRLSNGIIIAIRPACTWTPEPIYCSAAMASDLKEVIGSELEVARMPSSYKFDYLSVLIDDCLLEILKYLDVFELILLRNLNQRLQAVVDSELEKRCKEPFEIQLLHKKTFYSDLLRHSKKEGGGIKVVEADRMLGCVGNYVSSIHLSGTSFESKLEREQHFSVVRLDLIMDSLLKHCVNGPLTDLTICNFYLMNRMSIYAPIWQKLDTLELVNYDMKENELEAIFKNCRQLVRLKLDLKGVPNKRCYGTEMLNCNKITGTCFLKLPNTLKEFNLRNCKGLDLNMLSTFFENNKQLEVLHYSWHYSKRYPSTIGFEIYGIISKHLPNLKTLIVDNLGDRSELMCSTNMALNLRSLNSLGSLKYLKKLTIDVKNQNVSQMLIQFAQHGQLEELFMRNVQINPYTYDGLPTKFSSLKILRVRYTNLNALDSSYFLNLAKFFTFHNLIELHLEAERIASTSRRIELHELWPGLSCFIISCRKLYTIFLKIPSIELNIRDYHDVVIMSELRNILKSFQLYVSHQSVTKGLKSFLSRDKIRKPVVLKYIYYDLEYYQ